MNKGIIFISIIVTIILFVLQSYLSKRKQWYLGGIIPVLYIVFVVWYLQFPHEEVRYLKISVPLLIFLARWARGRNKFKSGEKVQESR